ncbi:hypothetical protein [Fructobacillus fructosus]|uniref:hypothetical protein n=1 Tax=Fructobacillus fructosus TaxID=1631 RepID=UPI002DA13B37|nr:unnamed protein product [Fructobacillus fructosus]
MIEVSEAYKIIKSFENPHNKQEEYSNKQNFHVKDNLIEYPNQKERWLAWLDSKAPNASFENVYNYIHSGPMLCYLLDSLNLNTENVVAYIKSTKGINNTNDVVESRFFREAFPYEVIEEAMKKKM